MNGRAFLQVARELIPGVTEAHWRCATGRAYYALMIECRDALQTWGFVPAPRENVHTFVRLKLTFASDPDLKTIGDALDRLVQWRNQADYHLVPSGQFASSALAKRAVGVSENAVSLLDRINADPARRKLAVATIRP